MTSYIVPLVIALIAVYGLVKGVPVFDTFLEGAKEGLQTSVNILPALVALLTCVGMFKASGGLDVLIHFCMPAATAIGMPGEVLPLAFLRPISGSGALVVFEDILRSSGANSMAGRTASVLMGSTETTFYTIAVYFGAAHVKRTRHTLVCSLSADLTGFLLSALVIRLFF